MTKLYENVKMLCDEKGLSILQLEREAGLKPRTINDWKESSPSTDKLLSVAQVLEVSTDFLLGNTDNRYSHIRFDTLSTNLILKACREYPLTDKSTQIIVSMIKTIAEIIG